MTSKPPNLIIRLLIINGIMLFLLLGAVFLGLSYGSTGGGMKAFIQFFSGSGDSDSTLVTIILGIRLPRVILAILVGGTLSLGGLVFQALLRNPLAEPYILGVSGGSAVGAIIGILIGLSRFPGVSLTAFLGSMATLLLVILMSTSHSILKKDSLLLAGVMINAFCSAIIIFLLSMTQDSRLHNILFWLMGDLSMSNINQVGMLSIMLLPCFLLVFWFSHSMNLLVMGKEMAMTMGVNIRTTTLALLIVTSFMVSTTVSYCGLLGFVGLVMPHMLRIILGPDHRILVPACVLGGGAYMVLCDLLARVLPRHGEIPAGVITAMIGAPLFIYLLKRSNR